MPKPGTILGIFNSRHFPPQLHRGLHHRPLSTPAGDGVHGGGTLRDPSSTQSQLGRYISRHTYHIRVIHVYIYIYTYRFSEHIHIYICTCVCVRYEGDV